MEKMHDTFPFCYVPFKKKSGHSLGTLAGGAASPGRLDSPGFTAPLMETLPPPKTLGSTKHPELCSVFHSGTKKTTTTQGQICNATKPQRPSSAPGMKGDTGLVSSLLALASGANQPARRHKRHFSRSLKNISASIFLVSQKRKPAPGKRALPLSAHTVPDIQARGGISPCFPRNSVLFKSHSCLWSLRESFQSPGWK